MKKILHEIELERIRQDQKWGGPNHDDGHSREDWCEFITDHAQPFRSKPWDFRMQMIRVAALAVAAIQAEDRGGYGKPEIERAVAEGQQSSKLVEKTSRDTEGES